MRTQEATDAPVSSTSSTWRWRLQARKMFSRLSKTCCLLFSQSTESTTEHQVLLSCAFLILRQWRSTAQISPTSVSTLLLQMQQNSSELKSSHLSLRARSRQLLSLTSTRAASLLTRRWLTARSSPAARATGSEWTRTARSSAASPSSLLLRRMK